MVVWLAELLSSHYTFFNVLTYLSVRMVLAVLTALAFSLWAGPKLIRFLQSQQIGQIVRDDGPESHFSKAGTPTMGGVLILAAIILSTLLWARLDNLYVWIVLFTTVAFGAIGFMDDYLKVVRKHPDGLIARWKYFWQSVAALTLGIVLYLTAQGDAQLTLVVLSLKNICLI